MVLVNPDDREFYDKKFRVSLGRFADTDVFEAYSDCEQNALDEVIDYCDKQGFKGYFLSQSEVDHMTDDELDQYVCGGNFGRYVAETDCVRIQEVNYAL